MTNILAGVDCRYIFIYTLSCNSVQGYFGYMTAYNLLITNLLMITYSRCLLHVMFPQLGSPKQTTINWTRKLLALDVQHSILWLVHTQSVSMVLWNGRADFVVRAFVWRSLKCWVELSFLRINRSQEIVDFRERHSKLACTEHKRPHQLKAADAICRDNYVVITF